MLRNPTRYNIPIEEVENDPTLYMFRTNIAHTAACILDKYNLVKYDRKSGMHTIKYYTIIMYV